MGETIEPTTAKQTDAQQEKFARFEKAAGHPAWVMPLRRAGMARFTALGFPTLKDEDWRFTNVAPIAKLPFKPMLQPVAAPDPVVVAQMTLGKIDAWRLVFVNGHFSPELSSVPAPAEGVVIGSLGAALTANRPLVEQWLGRRPPEEQEAFAALNTAFFLDGGLVYVPAGRVVPVPIHLLFVSTAKDTGATTHPRNLIVAERGSQVTVIESYARTTETAYLTNAVTELVAGEDAVVEHCRFQDESLSAYHVASIEARLGRGSRLVSHSLAMGARLSRATIRTALAGEGVACVLNGLYLTRGDQLADHHMVVEHAEPQCESHEYFNGILDGRSKGVFHGRILVRPGAQKTDAKQTNKNLLLSEEATIDTKPQLEIYADDVKCTHGATVGQLSDESIFYLRARGIGADTARRMLIHAFAGEIIERIRCRPAREELDRLVWNRLEANPHVGAEDTAASGGDHVRRP